MRAGAAVRRWAKSLFLSFFIFPVLFSATAFSAAKVKPDLPIGEEIEKASAPQGEEADPHATAPAQHGESPADKASTSAPAAHTPEDGKALGEEHLPASTAGEEAANKSKLLEGKVDPAVPAQGKGFIWFAAVFVLLALAIFIFT